MKEQYPGLRTQYSVRLGMTLVELLVVLTILAVLTSVAVTSTDVLLGQGRYEATQRTLKEIEEAVLGSSGTRQADGTLVGGGFLADMGRLPLAASDDPRFALAELWAMPDSVLAFDVRSALGDAEVLVGSGWRGPYLRLPIGRNELRDGWGNPLDVLNAAGNAARMGETITAVGSRGADGLPGGSGYNADLRVSLDDIVDAKAGVYECRATMRVGGNVYLVDAEGRRQNPPDPEKVRVVLFGPNPASEGPAEIEMPVKSSGGAATYGPNPNIPLTIGPRSLRAYWLGAEPPAKSLIRRIEHGGVFDLEIPIQTAPEPDPETP